MQIILDCNVRRLTVYETQSMLKAKGIDLSYKSVKNYRARLRLQAQNWIAKLAKSRKADYIGEYKARIEEVQAIQHKLWAVINWSASGPKTQVEACGKLLDCTSQLIELYDSLPLLTAIRDYDKIQEPRQDIPTAENPNPVSDNRPDPT